ncbi:AraC-like DNA-binding protein [Actinoalloteichus hymeniacidonis]|nr:AraC-like DNA-binding protein [Actinoalloteichus hymeniacidonis]
MRGATSGEWSRYWRAPDLGVEAIHAHFERHTYHRHTHDAYSFGLTEAGSQAFTCRGAARTSGVGMVMAFNPDEPHDGHAAEAHGFTYRMVYLEPKLIENVIADSGAEQAGLPLFIEPVVHDPLLFRALFRLHRLLDAGSALERGEALDSTVRALVRRASVRPPRVAGEYGGPSGVDRVRQLLHASYAEDLRVEDLAEVAGCSRYALHRGFMRTTGLALGDYQRQLRLRAARRLLAEGTPPAAAATAVGFADQSHLTRWFGRYYGITPAVYRSAAAHG